MKKTLTLLLCLTLVLATASTCFAATTEVTATGTADVDVTRTIESEFTVSIPKSVELGSGTSKTFEIGAKGNISATKQVEVTYDSATIAMTRTGDDSYSGNATLEFDNNVTALTWTEANIGSDDYVNQGGTITFAETKAGEYTGSVTFNIALSNK